MSFTFKAATSALEVILFRFGQVLFSLTRMFAAHHEKKLFSCVFKVSIEYLGPVPRKMVKFNPGLSQISSTVFSSKIMQLEVTKYYWALITQNVPLSSA